jgi:hypothetical protein
MIYAPTNERQRDMGSWTYEGDLDKVYDVPDGFAKFPEVREGYRYDGKTREVNGSVERHRKGVGEVEDVREQTEGNQGNTWVAMGSLLHLLGT